MYQPSRQTLHFLGTSQPSEGSEVSIGPAPEIPIHSHSNADLSARKKALVIRQNKKHSSWLENPVRNKSWWGEKQFQVMQLPP